MMEFWTNYLWPLIIMLAQSVLMLVVLLLTGATSRFLRATGGGS